jgi:exodeoxyribonuclease-3
MSTSVRALHPEATGPYPWRFSRGRTMATPGLAARATKSYVARGATHAERWRDHAPVTVVFDR